MYSEQFRIMIQDEIKRLQDLISHYQQNIDKLTVMLNDDAKEGHTRTNK